jgi:two-component system cell cycle sensor histidine kinase/response regulator CckA
MSDQTARPGSDHSGTAGDRAAPRQTILLADDEETVYRLATTILENHGYTVLGAKDGERVVQVFEAAKNQVALIVLDQRMPGPGLEATLAALLAIDPQVRVLLMSGYTEPELAPEISRSLRGFLGKPFRGGELLRAVEMALAGP